MPLGRDEKEDKMVTLYACLGSGNCFKPWLAMQQLHQDFDLALIDVLSGEQKTPAYLAVNPLGVVPFLVTADGADIGESNAMIWYLAEGTHLMPATAAERAETLQWMFFEQSKLEPFISPARFFTTILPERQTEMRAEIAQWQSLAKPGLDRLDDHLTQRKFMLQSGYSIADIAVFGYVHVLQEAGLDWADYPHIARWVADVEKTAYFNPLSNLGQPIAPHVRMAG